jgi:hypothetical protein
MDDIENNQPETAELSPADLPEQQAAEAEQPEGQQPESDAPESVEDDAAEFEELEIEGKKYALPKELKDKFLMQQDYTRKTQELAREREQSQAEIAQEKARIEADRQEFQAAAKLMQIGERLQQYQNVDWRALNQSDPQKAQEMRWEFDDLQRAYGQIDYQIKQSQQQRALREQQAKAQAAQQAESVLAREIPGWKPEMWGELGQVAMQLGAKPDEIAPVQYAPWLVKALHSHKVLTEMRAKAKTAPPPPPAAPVRKVSTVSDKAGFDPMSLPMEQWIEIERKRAAKLGRRY